MKNMFNQCKIVDNFKKIEHLLYQQIDFFDNKFIKINKYLMFGKLFICHICLF